MDAPICARCRGAHINLIESYAIWGIMCNP